MLVFPTVGFLVCLISVETSDTAPGEEPKEVNAPIGVVLSAGQATYEVGQRPKFTVRITNHTDRPMLLVGSLDGSDVGWRYPKLTVQRDGPVEPEGISRCGNTNNLKPNDFIAVEPGESFDPFMVTNEHGFFSHFLLRDTDFEKPGIYQYTLSYDTDEKDIAQWWGLMSADEPSEEVRRLFEEVPKLKATSNTVTITVVPAPTGDGDGAESPPQSRDAD